MQTPGLVSVVIPCYNAAPYIAATLDSVFENQRVPLQVIVVDDGSTDGSGDIIASRFPAAILFRNSNQGPSAARNFGTARATGEFVQYLDADDLLAPGKLAIQRAALETSGAEVAYGDWLKFSTLPGGTKRIEQRLNPEMGTSPELDLFTGLWCPPAVYLLRRSIVDRTGGWRINLPVIQDARFMLDCALQNARFVRCAAPMAEYRVHSANSVSTRSRQAFLRDCLRNALEMRDWWTARSKFDTARRQAVAGVVDMVANASCPLDSGLFDEACRAMATLKGRHPPSWPARKKATVSLLGYRASIALASRLRRRVSA